MKWEVKEPEDDAAVIVDYCDLVEVTAGTRMTTCRTPGSTRGASSTTLRSRTERLLSEPSLAPGRRFADRYHAVP